MSVHRNAPCPCGSGKKFKQCHGRAGVTLTRPVSLPLWAILGIGVILVGAAVLVFTVVNRNAATSRILPAPGFGTTLPGGAGGPEPAPYAYDPTTNRYWDPSHKHWHDGPPPDSALRVAGTPAATVTPVPTATPARSDSAPR